MPTGEIARKALMHVASGLPDMWSLLDRDGVSGHINLIQYLRSISPTNQNYPNIELYYVEMAKELFSSKYKRWSIIDRDSLSLCYRSRLLDNMPIFREAIEWGNKGILLPYNVRFMHPSHIQFAYAKYLEEDSPIRLSYDQFITNLLNSSEELAIKFYKEYNISTADAISIHKRKSLLTRILEHMNFTLMKEMRDKDFYIFRQNLPNSKACIMLKVDKKLASSRPRGGFSLSLSAKTDLDTNYYFYKVEIPMPGFAIYHFLVKKTLLLPFITM